LYLLEVAFACSMQVRVF